jgi:type II secretory pathway component PulK
MTTPGGITAVGLNPRAMLPIPLLTRQVDTQTSAKLSQSQYSTPIHTVGELRLVLGMTDAIYQAAASGCTVYSENPSVDPAIAPRLVLMAVSNSNVSEVDMALARRSSTTSVQPTAGQNVVGHALTISAEMSADKLTVRRVAIVRLTRQALKPEWVDDWR